MPFMLIQKHICVWILLKNVDQRHKENIDLQSPRTLTL